MPRPYLLTRKKVTVTEPPVVVSGVRAGDFVAFEKDIDDANLTTAAQDGSHKTLIIPNGDYSAAEIANIQSQGGKVIQYINGSYALKKEGPSTGKFPTTLYAKASNGQFLRSQGFGNYLMDIGQEAWLVSRAQTALDTQAQYGSAGIFLDMLGIASVDGNYVGYWVNSDGVTFNTYENWLLNNPDRLSTNPVSGIRFVGAKPIDPNTGSEYTATNWMKVTAEVGNRVKAALGTGLVGGNAGLRVVNFASTQIMYDLCQIDWLMSENWLRGSNESLTTWFPNDTDYLTAISMVTRTNAYGSKFLGINQYANTNTTQAQRDLLYRYSVATVMMGGDGQGDKVCVMYKVPDGAGGWIMHGMDWPAWLDTVVGLPFSNPPTVKTNGVWQRQYSTDGVVVTGLVMANTTATTVAAVPLPSGTWTDAPTGATFTGTVSVSGNDVRILTLTSGGAAPPPPAATVIGLRQSGNTNSSAVVTAFTENATAVQIVVSDTVDLAAPVYTSPVLTPDAYGTVKATATGLAQNRKGATRYYTGVMDNGVLLSTGRGRLTTFPTTTSSMNITIGGCARVGEPFTHWSFRRMFSKIPIAHINVGDFGYPNLHATSNTVQDFITFYKSLYANPDVALLLNEHPVPYVGDDHDVAEQYGKLNDGAWANFHTAFRKLPNYPLPATDTFNSAFSIGTMARVIMLDCRSKRDATTVDPAVAEMLGAAQTTWLHNEITNATESMIWIVSPVAWAAHGSDSWAASATGEQNALIDFINASGKKSKIVMFCGDVHRLGFDDGTNSPGGIPFIECTPMLGDPSSGGTYSHGSYNAGLASFDNHQFAWLVVTGSGSGPFTLAFTGWDAKTNTQVLSMTLTI